MMKYDNANKPSLETILHQLARIRRALAQSVSDHWHFGKGEQTTTSAMTNCFCFKIHQQINIVQKWIQK